MLLAMLYFVPIRVFVTSSLAKYYNKEAEVFHLLCTKKMGTVFGRAVLNHLIRKENPAVICVRVDPTCIACI